jgi:serine/threonine protein kinase
VLGQGGYGITYLAYERTLDRRVALKELFPRQYVARIDRTRVAAASPSERTRFEQAQRDFIGEARRIAKFHHDHIVRIHHLFQANGTAYFVMDYIEGSNFRVWMERNRSPKEAQLAPLLGDLLSGLDYVHAHGILHQDVSPENILIDPQGRPILIDFGSSRAAGQTRNAGEGEVTRAGYSALELYVGGRRGPYTDLYALAGVMMHALTGQTPPTALDRRADPATFGPVAQRLAGRYRASFLNALDQAFAVQPEQRPQDVNRMQKMLAEQKVRPVPWWRSWNKKRWRPWKVSRELMLRAGVLAAAVLIAALAWWKLAGSSGGTTDGGHDVVKAVPGLQGNHYRSGSGMEFIEMPMLGSPAARVFVSLRQTRCADYAFYVPGYVAYIPFAQDLPGFAAMPETLRGDYPVVRISQAKAVAFCQTMTDQEAKAGLLPAGAFFRLPTREEWSRAAHEDAGNAYPWGNDWPPRDSVGHPLANLADVSLGQVNVLQKLYPVIEGYDDGYATTAPVGSFSLRSPEGLFDLGSNVEEWCAEVEGSTATARGASWRDSDGSAATTARMDREDANGAFDWIGLRVVLELPVAH